MLCANFHFWNLLPDCHPTVEASLTTKVCAASWLTVLCANFPGTWPALLGHIDTPTLRASLTIKAALAPRLPLCAPSPLSFRHLSPPILCMQGATGMQPWLPALSVQLAGLPADKALSSLRRLAVVTTLNTIMHCRQGPTCMPWWLTLPVSC